MDQRSFVLSLVAASFLLCVASLYMGYRELDVFLGASTSTQNRIEDVRTGQLQFGLSTHSHDMALDECRLSLMSVSGRVQSEEDRRAASRTCLSAARAILSASPANSFAAFIAAYSSGVLGQPGMLREYLERSRATAPNELWLASLRARSFREWLQGEGDPSPFDIRGDIALMGRADRGRRWLAQWYMSDEPARLLIARAMEGLPASDQSAFLQIVRALSQSLD